jgi:hypothetical protein
MTLIINATTAGYLLKYLDLLGNESVEKTLVMDQIKKKLRRKMNRIIQELSTKFDDEVISEVRNSCSLLRESNFENLYRDSDSKLFANNINNNTYNNYNYDGSSLRMSITSQQQQQQQQSNNNINNNNNRNEKRNVSTDENTRTFAFLTSRLTDNSNDINNNKNSLNNARSGNNHNSNRISNLSNDLSNNKARAREVSRLLSMSNRGENPMLNVTLVSYVRAIFLEIVRVQYWHSIEAGKLPRLSHSAQFLLYSIDVGLDNADDDYAPDWRCIENHLDENPLVIRFLSYCEDYVPFCPFFVSSTIGFFFLFFFYILLLNIQ